MPMYLYACRECGHDFDKQLRMSEAGEPQACPHCGGQETRKRIGAVALSGGATRPAPAVAAPATSPFT